MLYFVLLTLANLAIARTYAAAGWPTLRAAMPTLLAGLCCALILGGLAWAVGRTTRYTITTRHVVMQFGVAIRATLVVPLHRIAGTSVRVHGDRTGDISLRLFEGEQVPFLKLWPHVRPWRYFATEPMLRDVPRAAVAATLLSRTLSSAASTRTSQRTPVRAAETQPLQSDGRLRHTSADSIACRLANYNLRYDFYRTFDQDVQYSCAFFARGDESLEAAQHAKKRLIAASCISHIPG
jgi:hypothetical protein